MNSIDFFSKSTSVASQQLSLNTHSLAQFKDRLEVFCAGDILHPDNFGNVKGFGWAGFKSTRLWRQDKGQKACAQAFFNALDTGNPKDLLPFDELVEVAEACFDAVDQIAG